MAAIRCHEPAGGSLKSQYYENNAVARHTIARKAGRGTHARTGSWLGATMLLGVEEVASMYDAAIDYNVGVPQSTPSPPLL